MSSLTCNTCKEKFNNDDISKHLSTTRHKNVTYDKLDEVIECEECEDTNIHQLQILRFGLNDMSLLCQMCLGKEDKPSVNYSLSNGSLFKKIDQYYRFRDIECVICSDDNRLFVGNKPKQQVIVCKKCLPEYQETNPGMKFTSEDDDNFLSVLLGITNFVPPKNAKNRGRKMKRGGKKAGGRKKMTPQQEKDAEERRNHYFSKMSEAKLLKSGSTVKAVGTEPEKKNNAKPEAKSVNGKGGKNVKASGPGNKPTKGVNKGTVSNKGNTSNVSNGPKTNGKKDQKPNGKAIDPKPSKGKDSRPGKDSKPNGNVRADSKKSIPKPESGPKAVGPKAVGPKAVGPKAAGPKAVGPKAAGPKAAGPKASAKSGPKKNTQQPSVPNSKPGSKNTPQTSNPNSNQGSKKNTPQSSTTNSKAPSAAQSRSTTPQKENNVLETLPPGIEQYNPSKTPLMTYDSMDQYFREMSYNLFLEEKLSLEASHNVIISSEDMTLLWYEDNDKRNKQYKIETELTQEFRDKYLNKKIQKFKKIPFSVDQTIFLMLNGSIAWSGKVVLAETFKKNKRSKTEFLELIIDLFPWNDQPLPKNVNIKYLSILPASIPVSRVFLAMSRIENPKFKKMLLGKEPIRHLNFNNYVKFSEGSRFNESQKVGLQSVLNNAITVLQGPPGTGKTSTIHEIILQLLNNFNTYPILVVAASNIAIDNLAEKLLPSHGTSILRIVANEKESDYNRDHPLSSICLHNKIYDMLPMVFKETLAKLKTGRANEVSVNQYKKVLGKQIELSQLLIAQARVIFTTSVVAGGNQLKSVKKFPVVIMDESTQSSESITLIPLSMPGVDKFVFVGDQKQLSSFTQLPSLSLSLFERVLMNGTYKEPHMLNVQYRMHPRISEFPRNKFYQGLLKDGITAEDRTIDSIKNPVQFWDTQGRAKEERVRIRMREDNGYTYTNSKEIDYIIEVLVELIINKKITKSDIGIITPYRGQRDLISKKLKENPIINPANEEIKIEVDRDDIYNESKPVTIHMVSDIMIASIDAFQGREKQFIIMSCVRSNNDNKIGFLNDERRLNVALTRAQYGLILIGDVKCLAQDTLWSEYLQHLQSQALISVSDQFKY